MTSPGHDTLSGNAVNISGYKALIFDVDGTLAETEETHRRAFNDTFAYFHLPWTWSADDYRKLLKVTGGKERMRHFADDWQHDGGPVSDDEIVKMHRFKTERYAQLVAASGCPLRPGVASLIEAARSQGQRLAIATTTSRGNVAALLDATLGEGSMQWFEAVVAGDEVKRKKPAPDVYLEALRVLDLAGHDCVAFEDLRNGLLSALGAGIAVVVTPSFYTETEDFSGATAVLTTL